MTLLNPYELSEKDWEVLTARGFARRDIKNAHAAYTLQKNNCLHLNKKDKNGDQVLMKMSFYEWLTFWLDSGLWNKRGKGAGKFCMSRKGDVGHYELGNVFIQLHSANISDAHRGKPKTPNQLRSVRRKCEVFGEVFEKTGDVGRKYGRAAYKDPSFRYLD